MKIKQKKHSTLLVPESKADLLAISKIMKNGMIISGTATRSIEIDKGGRKEKVRKKFRPDIQVEEWKLEHGRMRIKGRIVSEHEWVPKFSYQSIELGESDELLIKDELSKAELSFLSRFRQKQEPVLVCLIDDRECQLYLVDESSSEIARLSRHGGKDFDQADNNYYKASAELISRHYNGRLVVAGPGFARETLGKLISSRGMKFISDSTAHTGMAGLREVLRRGLLDRLGKAMRITHESNLVEDFFTALASGKPVAYGRQNVDYAADMGAVETLLISDEFLSDELIRKVEKQGGNVEIISSGHEAGKRFLEFSGYAAFLRFKLFKP